MSILLSTHEIDTETVMPTNSQSYNNFYFSNKFINENGLNYILFKRT